MKISSKTKLFTLCTVLLIGTAANAIDTTSPLLVMEKKGLGLKLSLPASYQKPISDTLSTQDLTNKILRDPGALLKEIDQVREEREKNITEGKHVSEEELTHKHPLRFFDACGCIPEDIYISFTKKAVDQAVALYKQKDPRKPFVYGSFASGGLFPDLYTLTSFINELRNQNIQDIHLQVNLVDTDLQDYITQHSRGLSRSALPAKQAVHSHMLFYKPTSAVEFSNAENVSDLIISFLQWFTQNLKIKLDLYVYGIGQDYVYDHENNRVLSHDMLMAIDYFPETQGDLAQLAARTIKLGGYLASLDNKDPEDILAHPGLMPAIPATYKELAQLVKEEKELAQQDNVSHLYDEIVQKSNRIVKIWSLISDEYGKTHHSDKVEALIKERETLITRLESLEKEAQNYGNKNTELSNKSKEIFNSKNELIEKGYDEEAYNKLDQQHEKIHQETDANNKALEELREKIHPQKDRIETIEHEINKEKADIQSSNIASLEQEKDTLQHEIDKLHEEVNAEIKKQEEALKAPVEYTASTVISKKIADISAKTYKDLLQRARGDSSRIGKLFDSLFYPQSKILMFQSERIKKALKFDPLTYFKVEYETAQKYKSEFGDK